MGMDIVRNEIEGVFLLKPKVFDDERGFFLETHRKSLYEELTGGRSFVQDNHSRSTVGVLRGLHYQLRHPQGKLVYVVRGRVLDVAVDIRRGSPTFGRWAAFELSDVNHHQVYIEPGFAHGFKVLSDHVDVIYKCTDYYVGDDQYGIAWNDSALNIDWNATTAPVLSSRDREWPTLTNVPDTDLPTFCEA